MTTFTAHDRCDRCGAQAQARATLVSLMLDTGFAELLLCGHHSHKFGTTLAGQGWSVEHRTTDILVSADTVSAT